MVPLTSWHTFSGLTNVAIFQFFKKTIFFNFIYSSFYTKYLGVPIFETTTTTSCFKLGQHFVFIVYLVIHLYSKITLSSFFVNFTVNLSSPRLGDEAASKFRLFPVNFIVSFLKVLKYFLPFRTVTISGDRI